MIEIGKINHLQVIKFVDFGLYLDGLEWGEILLPNRYVNNDMKITDWLDVFIYFDSEDRIVASTEPPQAMVGEFANLKVIDINNAGAFLDWGLEKDLLVPFSEQSPRMQLGNYYLVYIYIDEESERIVASSKLNSFLHSTCEVYQAGDKVELIIAKETELGYKVIVDDAYWGLIYKNEVFSPVKIGETHFGKIKKLREDKKLDCKLLTSNNDLGTKIIKYLIAQNGKAEIGDKTPTDKIYSLFQVSKKVYKRTLSSLYKARKITIEGNWVSLVKDKKSD